MTPVTLRMVAHTNDDGDGVLIMIRVGSFEPHFGKNILEYNVL